MKRNRINRKRLACFTPRGLGVSLLLLSGLATLPHPQRIPVISAASAVPAPPTGNNLASMRESLVPRAAVAPPVVILKERSSGQQFILNPGQDIALVLPYDKLLSASGETLFYPLPAVAPVSSGYGMRVHPISGLASFHQGIDLSAPLGTPVLAAFSGQVVAAGSAGNLGNAVVLAHDDSRRTRYGHLSQITVQPGTWIHQGDAIGYVGTTGRSTGPHLHFEYWLRQGQWAALDISDALQLASTGKTVSSQALQSALPAAASGARNWQ